MKKKINIGNMGPQEYEEYARKHNDSIKLRNARRKALSKNLTIEAYLLMLIISFLYVCNLEGVI
ncbi:MAG: hypothetical protein ACO20H_09040 [Bacteriovoracaceae bacterium]